MAIRISAAEAINWSLQMNILAAKYRAWRGTHSESQMVFVLGTGRSGTHWIGNILDSHADFRVTVEKRSLFNLVTTMALDPSTKRSLFPKLVRRYRVQHARVAPKHYGDKSHPNIWLADELAEVFPNARFVGIQRNVYATVASMLKHRGALKWQEGWRKFPIPNAFLGITDENAAHYEALPVAAKCALRWLAHEQQMDCLRNMLGESLIVLSYEDVIQDTERQLEKLTQFLCLTSPFPIPAIKIKSLDKWRTELDEEAIAAIDLVTKTSNA